MNGDIVLFMVLMTIGVSQCVERSLCGRLALKIITKTIVTLSGDALQVRIENDAPSLFEQLTAIL